MIDKSIEAEIHADYAKKEGLRRIENGVSNNDLLIHRLYGAANVNGKDYRVKTTIHEHKGDANIPHDYKVTEVKLIVSGSPTSNARTSKTSAEVAKLLKGVEKSYDKGKYLLDESEEIRFRTESISYEKELNEIKNKAVADGTFMTAPNGKATKLTERQWLQVRTKAFKDWFGDWEKAWKADFLLSDNYVKELTGKEFAKSDTPITKTVGDYYAKKYNGSVERKGLGIVELNKRSVKDSISHGLGRNKAVAFTSVPEVITDGVIIDRQTNWKGRGYDSYTIAAPISIGGDGYTCVVVVIEGHSIGKRSFYLHEVALQKNLQDAYFKTDTKAEPHQGDIANVLRKIITTKENSSKVVNENGEPMVVYHGTRDKSNFSVFDYNKAGVGNDWGLFSRGFYFSPNVRTADGYRGIDGNRYDVFLNLQNPLYVNDFNSKTELADYLDISDSILFDQSIGYTVSYGFGGTMTSAVIEKGHDGVIVIPKGTNTIQEIVAYEPNQIKSVRIM